jgi:transposase InsO family protein
VNAKKSEWAVQETDWLGHWITPTGLKPWRKKVDAILSLARPTTLKQLRSFIGAVNFYRDMYPKRSHILAPLTELTKHKGKVLPWTQECEKAFNNIRSIMAQEVLLRYPDHNQPYHIYTDASDYQLGAVIMQNDAPVAFYSRKLNPAQRNYTTMEKELLSIVETCKEFRNNLYGCKELHIHTDHKNLTYANLNSQRVIRWRLYLEEFNPIFHYVEGEENTLADALSRLPHVEGQTAEDDGIFSESWDHPPQIDASDSEQDGGELVHSYSLARDDEHLCDVLLSFPEPQEDVPYGTNPCPVDYNRLAQEQAKDARLQKLLTSEKHVYGHMYMTDNVPLICRKNDVIGADWQICIPDASLNNIILWYHMVLNHTGMTRLHDTMATHFHHPDMRTRISELLKSCDSCQRFKTSTKAYSHLPPREAEISPWRVVALDLIGPWKIKVHGEWLTIQALTVIDTVTNYPEIIRIRNKSTEEVITQFENAWLSRYPKPRYVIYDQGPEFKSYEFHRFLAKLGIDRRRSSVKNPQSNAIVERMHQTMGNILRTLAHVNPPKNEDDVNQIIDTALQTVAYTVRAAVHSSMKMSPGALAFNRDMILDIPLKADLYALQDKRQLLIDKRLIEANRRRVSHDYEVGELVLKLKHPTEIQHKLDVRATGPFKIERVHANGTLTIRTGKHYTERINIRRVKPYHAPVS